MTVAIAIIGSILLIFGVAIAIIVIVEEDASTMIISVPILSLLSSLFILGLVASASEPECAKKDLIYCHCVNIEKPKTTTQVIRKKNSSFTPEAKEMTQPVK